MKEEIGNIFDSHITTIVVPTNGFVTSRGRAVMGRGLARQIKLRYPGIDLWLGEKFTSYGNHVFYLAQVNIITFPTKHHWSEKSDITLIERSTEELKNLVDDNPQIPQPVYLPKVGCGNGKLDWKVVKPILTKYLDDRFVVRDIH